MFSSQTEVNTGNKTEQKQESYSRADYQSAYKVSVTDAVSCTQQPVIPVFNNGGDHDIGAPVHQHSSDGSDNSNSHEDHLMK